MGSEKTKVGLIAFGIDYGLNSSVFLKMEV
jgi:hypothetical protein